MKRLKEQPKQRLTEVWSGSQQAVVDEAIGDENGDKNMGLCRLCSYKWATFPTFIVVQSLSVNATKTLVQAFISCRLDYCNSLLFGISDGLLRRLQSVPNAAARLVTGARRCDHITPVLSLIHI